MKEAITNLGKEETQQLTALTSNHMLDPPTAHRAQKHYRELRRLNLAQDNPLSVEQLMRTAIVIAEQSQPVYNMQGLRVGPVCLALNQMMNSKATLRAVVSGIKLYLGCRGQEEELKNGLARLLEQLSFGSGYLAKFERAIDYFDFVELTSCAFGYLAIYRSFAWLLFLLIHKRVSPASEAESDYLLIAVLYLMVRYGFEYIRPRSAPTLGSSKTLVTSILSQLFQIFEIDHPSLFKKVTSLVDEQFEHLMAAGVLRCHSNYDFLSPELISYNYKKIDALYQRCRDQEVIDYRLLLENRHQNLTPIKHTNITPRGHQPDRVNNRNNQPLSFASHKILTFEGEDDSEPCQPSKPQQPVVSESSLSICPAT
jgi:hypothetical protein